MPKISQYPSMSAPTGAEILVGDQTGVTSTATVAQLTALAQGGFSAVDSGVANAYVLTTSRPLPALLVGQTITFTPQHPNTTASTVSVNGGGVLALVDSAGNAFTGGELTGPATIYWTGAQWELLWTLPLANKRTAAEIAAAVTPVNYAFPPGDVRRYGATGNGINNDLTALQAAVNQSPQTIGGAPAYMPSGTYNVAGGTLLLANNCVLIGAGRNVATITGSTTGILIDGYPNAANNVYLAHFSVISTGSAAYAFRFGNGVQHILMDDIAANGAGGAGGAGIAFSAGTPGRFSGNFHATLCYFSGFYYGLQFIDGTGQNKWTTVSFKQCYLNGPSAAAGSIGIWQDANSNLTGSSFLAGAISGFAKPVQLDLGAAGSMTIDCDIESNTNSSTFAAFSSFHYRTAFSSTNEPPYWWQDANGSAQIWARARNWNGVLIEEQYSNRYQVILSDSTNALDCAIRAGGSLLNGSSPSFVGGVHVQPAGLTNPSNNWMYAPNGQNKMCWGTAPPTGGTWQQGDICWNTGVPAAGTLLWACTVPGTPGTWTAVTIP